METFGGRFFEIVIGGGSAECRGGGVFQEKSIFRLQSDTELLKKINAGRSSVMRPWNKTMPSSAGKLVDRMEVRIDSEDPFNKVGEIQVKGAECDERSISRMKRPHRKRLPTMAGFGTGDLGVIDKTNFVYIRGRSKNMILGPFPGQNIYPEEIESRIANLSYVAECVVTERQWQTGGAGFPR